MLRNSNSHWPNSTINAMEEAVKDWNDLHPQPVQLRLGWGMSEQTLEEIESIPRKYRPSEGTIIGPDGREFNFWLHKSSEQNDPDCIRFVLTTCRPWEAANRTAISKLQEEICLFDASLWLASDSYFHPGDDSAVEVIGLQFLLPLESLSVRDLDGMMRILKSTEEIANRSLNEFEGGIRTTIEFPE